MAIPLLLPDGRHLLADAAQLKVLQAERSVLAGWHLRERLGVPDALALARTQQDASPEDCDLATPRNAGCDEGRVLPQSGGVANRKQRKMELVQRS